MLSLNPPLAALHGARIDHTGAVAHGLINAAEHLTESALRLHNHMLSRITLRAKSQNHFAPGMLVAEIATDPEVQQMGAGIFQEQMHLAADIGTRWVAWGEWHQHSVNALFSDWLSRVQCNFSGLPAGAGIPVLQSAVDSADHTVSEAAAVAVQATEVVAAEIDRVEASVQNRRRITKK